LGTAINLIKLTSSTPQCHCQPAVARAMNGT